MKSLVKKQRTTNRPSKAPAKPILKAPRTAEAQCCAKVSRTIAGCHD